MMMGAIEFFLGRQPIVGRDRELVAYELLFRAGPNKASLVFDDVAATAAVIQHTLFDLGVEEALFKKRLPARARKDFCYCGPWRDHVVNRRRRRRLTTWSRHRPQ